MDQHLEETQKFKAAITEQTRSMEVLERNMQTVSREITAIVGKIEEARRGMGSASPEQCENSRALLSQGDEFLSLSTLCCFASFCVGAERADNERACHCQQSGALGKTYLLLGCKLLTCLGRKRMKKIREEIAAKEVGFI